MKRYLFVILAIFVLFSLGCIIGGDKQEVPPTAVPQQVMPTQPPTEPPAAEPTVPPALPPTVEPTIPPPPVVTEQATEAPTVDSGPSSDYFFDDFDGTTTENWIYEYITGNTKDRSETIVDENLMNVRLEPNEETHLKLYNTAYVYEDVYVETKFFNKGDNKNLIGVICRASDKGFIEFRITPGGFYEIHRFDFELKRKNINPYVEILKGASIDIKTLTNWNIIGMNCVGSDFEFYINGKLQRFAIPPALKAEFGKLYGGNVGVSVTNFANTTGAVEVQFDDVLTEAP